MANTFKIYCNGYSATKATLPEVQAYLDWLRSDRENIGREVQITPGDRTGDATLYDLGKMRRGLLTA